MSLKIDVKDIDKFIVIGDRVLIKPNEAELRTKSGLYLPPGVQEKEKIHSGYVLKAGPGYPIPNLMDENESWKNTDNVKYVPLQAKRGDLAVYLQKQGYEMEFNKEKYILVPQSAILLLIRDEDFLQ